MGALGNSDLSRTLTLSLCLFSGVRSFTATESAMSDMQIATSLSLTHTLLVAMETEIKREKEGDGENERERARWREKKSA